MAKLILLNMPIGDMADLSTRVIEGLKIGKHFAVEDTRTFRETLIKLGISTEKHILSFHDHSSEAKWERLLEIIGNGDDLYVCSEAGSPVLSDPAFPLVRLAHQKGIEVQTYSGISAVVAALELSGLPPIPFSFQGFLPRDVGPIRTALEKLPNGTHIFFESPNRIKSTVELCSLVWPEAEMAVVKEITKSFQTVIRFKAKEWREALSTLVEKGEFVWLIHLPSETQKNVSIDMINLANEILSEGVRNKTLSQLLGEILGRSSKEIYAELNRSR